MNILNRFNPIFFCCLSILTLGELNAAEKVEVGQWNFSLSGGYGKLSNPLSQADDFTLYLVPSAYYYGENWYFDNGDLGYTVLQQTNYSVSIISQLNAEYAHFADWHPNNFFLSTAQSNLSFSEADSSPNSPPDANDDLQYWQKSPDEIESDETHKSVINWRDLSSRRLAIDVGIQGHWFISSQQSIRMRLMHDINSVYDGFHASLEYKHQWRFKKLMLSAHLGWLWKSRDLANYYYGVSDKDTKTQALWYQPGQLNLPYARLSAAYPLTEAWKMLAFYQYQKLDNTLTASPMIADDARTIRFIGLNYAF
ncbi:MipA/OmpV family protein [Gayadomonas joobiniege]|uniref:MipA/OmpV family protein n=1 Tax=Gayadomonas joobiniege TaxID=1234606 RepID=UPI00138AC376|nr:MipA/OmpV family protein [Gayadomonas joobiniege]